MDPTPKPYGSNSKTKGGGRVFTFRCTCSMRFFFYFRLQERGPQSTLQSHPILGHQAYQQLVKKFNLPSNAEPKLGSDLKSENFLRIGVLKIGIGIFSKRKCTVLKRKPKFPFYDMPVLIIILFFLFFLYGGNPNFHFMICLF